MAFRGRSLKIVFGILCLVFPLAKMSKIDIIISEKLININGGNEDSGQDIYEGGGDGDWFNVF